MPINLYELSSIDSALREKLLRRSEVEIGNAASIAAPIIEAVRTRGDAALMEYALKFDKATISPDAIKASSHEFNQARETLPLDIKKAIETCAANVRRFHESQLQRVNLNWSEEVAPGVWAGEQTSPISSVGIYVPRGKGAFPSVMYMLCTPAMVAGVPQIAVCTPPMANGRVDDASLFAAEICGVRDVYKVGGAQAIAALAFGTETVPKVAKVVGPGNAYVSAARRLLSDHIDAGMPAGPTDALILADDSADPHNTALDLLIEAEHGPDSAALLVTPSKNFAEKVRKLLPALIDDLPSPNREYCATVMSNYGGILVTESMDEAIDFCNIYAAEHLMLKVRNPDSVRPRLTTSGEILTGETTPFVLGNFGVGVNNVLPTGGHARTWSATTVRDFLRVTTLARCTPGGYATLSGPVALLAEYEGFPSHANAIHKRHM